MFFNTMKNKTWIIFFFLIVFIIFVGRKGIIHYKLQYTFESSQMYDRGHWLKEKNLYPQIVFLGSSMTKYSIVPNIIIKNSKLDKGSVVNLGADAATPYEMYLTYIKNKNHFSKTKIFFYSIEPWLFSKKYYQYKIYEKVLWSEEEWKYYMPQWDYYAEYKTSLFDVIRKFKYINPKINDYGYVPKIHSEKKFKLATKQEVQTYFQDKIHDHLGISHFQLKYLKKLKDEIEKNNSELIILYIPNHISYTQIINVYNKNYNLVLSNLLNTYLDKTKQFGSFCPKDYNLKYEDYFDRFHLSHTGAKKFSKELGNVFKLSNKLKEKEIFLDYSCEN